MKRIVLALLFSLLALPALAADNLAVTPGAGALVRMRDTTGAGGPLSSYVILGDLTGASILGSAGVANGNVLTIQGIAAMTPILAAQSGAWSVAQSGTWNIGTVSTLTSITNPVAATQSGAWTVNPTTAANWGLAATAGAVPATAAYIGMNVAGNLVGVTGTGTSLNVNCTAGCAGSGGTSSTYGATFPTIGTAIGFTDGTNMVAGRVTTYGTAPTGFNALAVNAFVTNANANSRATAANSSPVVQPSAPNSGATAFPVISGASTNATSIKTSAAVVFGCQLGNNSTTQIVYVKIYNKASAPTVGTDVPVKTLIVPAPAAGGGGSNPIFGPGGFALPTGFALAITGGIANADTTVVSANQVVVNCDYE